LPGATGAPQCSVQLEERKRRSPCGLRRSCSSAFTCGPRPSASQLLGSVLPLDTVARVTISLRASRHTPRGEAG
jgi:hypothetical protein